MIKNIIFLMIFVMFLGSVNASFCYQQTANESTACGGLSTGVYGSSGSWNNLVGTYDGAWNTWGRPASGSVYMFANYSKPAVATSAIMEYGFDTGATVADRNNVTIPALCFNQDVIAIRIDSHSTGNTGDVRCWNGTDYLNITNDMIANREFYEEAITWELVDSGISVNLISPANNTDIASVNINLTSNTSVLGTQVLHNVTYYTWYSNGSIYSISEPILISGTSNQTTFQLTNVPANAFKWNALVCNGTSYCTYASANYTFNTDITYGLNITTGACNGLVYQINMKDEENLSSVYGTIAYNINYKIPSYNSKVIYGTLTNTSIFYICMNASIAPQWKILSAEFDYSTPEHVSRRYYIFNDTTITNSSTNLTFYNLKSSQQTSFKLEIEDNSLNPYSDRFTTLVRWYPATNEYSVVDMGNTDELGSTIIHVRAEDVDYRIGVYEKNGTLIKLANPIRMACISSPCTYTLKISPVDYDYSETLNIQYSLDYNTTSKIWTFQFSDPSQNTDSMNMTIWRMTGTSIYPICSNMVTGWSGAMNCNTTGYTGTLKATIYRTASPAIVFAQKIVDVVSSAMTSSYGLILSAFIGIPIIFIFAFVSPISAIIGGVIALIPAWFFGTITLTILGGIAIMGGIVAHFLKRIK